MEEPILLLASNSPRRRQLLTLAGWRFQRHPVEIDETPLPAEMPDAYVLRLAESKALAAAEQVTAPGLILAADTTVADEDCILGKPANDSEAYQMLDQLRGRTHSVYTALALFQPDKKVLITEVCKTLVKMRAYTDTEIQAYIASGDPVDKAGAYAIQHGGFHPVEKLEGCYANVVGLPLCLLQAMLGEAGVVSKDKLPLCPTDFNRCPLCSSLARGDYEI